jgi:hypothetical protein
MYCAFVNMRLRRKHLSPNVWLGKQLPARYASSILWHHSLEIIKLTALVMNEDVRGELVWTEYDSQM